MTAPVVTIVIVNWNGAADTRDCLESCARLVGAPEHAIVVVDNGSTDGSAAFIRQEFPQVHIIEAPTNLGFAGGNNLGFKWAFDAGSEFIWLLNNDTRVDPRALAELVQALRAERDAGIAGSKILYAADTHRLWFAGGYFAPSGLNKNRGQDQLDRGQFDRGGPVAYVSGCSLLIRAEVVRQIGPLREDYFMYIEDVEWHTRAHRLGWTSTYVPSSVVWHKVGASLTQGNKPKSYYYATRNWLDHVGHTEPWRLPLALAHVVAASTLSLLRGNSAMAVARFRGVADAARRRLGP